MTYGPGPGTGHPHQQPYQGPPYQQGPPPPQPVPLAPNGSVWTPPQPPGPGWTGPPAPRRNRRAALIAALIAAVVIAGVVITVVLTSGNDNATAWSSGTGTSGAPGPAPTSATGPQPSSSDGARPLPPPTPTGKLYKDEDPQVGACADLSRKPTGVSIYQADCADPAAMLILESVLPSDGKCPGKGYFGLDSLSNQLLCFTYNVGTGDCIDMAIPRRTSCDDTPGAAPGPPKTKVVDVHLGQRDGAGCPNPNLFYQVGKDDQRAVACLAPATGNGSPPPPSSR